MKTTPFIRIFAGTVVLAFCLSVVFDVSVLYILSGFALLYLSGLMLVGVFTPSPKPFSDAEPNSPRAAEDSPPKE
ncbi:MAG TPA: hypothetical protein VGX78_18765 [Pirellulales bacterium]|jgi:hypothetical protein|nr:hypothetical protein [Pirellulales bacterium]